MSLQSSPGSYLLTVADSAQSCLHRFLHDLKASLSKAEALERRAPPKMQTYVQKYFDYDAQRRQKGQLALVQLPPPPMLCRHFRSAHTQNSSNAAEQSHVADLKDRHLEDMRKMLSHIDAPLCSRRSSHSSLQDDEKRTPLLEKVTSELDDATETLEEAIKRSQKILKQQDSAKNKITETVEMANSVETLMGGEIFQQVSPGPRSCCSWCEAYPLTGNNFSCACLRTTS